MDTQSTFDFDEPKQASAMNETEIDAIDADAGMSPSRKTSTTFPALVSLRNRTALKSPRLTRRVQVGWPVMPRTTASWYRLRRRPPYMRPPV